MEILPVTCLVPAADSLGEGCMWDEKGQCLWWLDIARPSRIHRLDPATGSHRVWHTSLTVTAMALRSKGGILLAGEDGLYCFDPVTGAITAFCKPEKDRPDNRFNDGACDPQGRFWVGTMHQNIGPKGEDLPIPADTGALYCVDGSGAAVKWEDNVGVSNGPCWSPDGRTFYFSDSKNQLIYAYDFDGTAGRIANRRVLNGSKDHGYPDGATVDAEGYVWSARWDGSCVLRIDPKGRIDRVIAMPALRPTCVCFGGPDLDIMYVTSSRAHLDQASMARYPLQGGLFCFDPGVRGTRKFSFSA